MKQTLTVNGTSRERYVRIGNTTTKALCNYIAARKKFDIKKPRLWSNRDGGELSSSGIDGIIRKIGRRAGIKLHPHL